MSELSYNAFDQAVEEYDAWYEHNELFTHELATLGVIGYPCASSIEIGVGTGRFAQRLHIPFGIDPALNALKLAYRRGIRVFNARAESLPFEDNLFNRVYFIFSLCFVQDQRSALKEAIRILKKDGNGKLIVGFVPKDSPWGRLYKKKGDEGHKLYRHANFFSPKQLDSWVKSLDFVPDETISSLLFSPEDKPYPKEPPLEYLVDKAGFVVKTYKIAN